MPGVSRCDAPTLSIEIARSARTTHEETAQIQAARVILVSPKRGGVLDEQTADRTFAP